MYCCLVEASSIQYEVASPNALATSRRHVGLFFDELLGTLTPHLENVHPLDHTSHHPGDASQRVFSFYFIHDMSHVILHVKPSEKRLALDIMWETECDPGFVIGLVKDYFRARILDAHCFEVAPIERIEQGAVIEAE